MRSPTAITLLSTFANAYKTFETVCTKPTEVVNYVSSADTRSTLDILWSCLLTIVACTWSVQHLNVPEQRDGRDQGWMGDIKWTMKRSWTSTKWMLATVIAPEYLLMKNWGDLCLAKKSLYSLRRLAAEDNVPWSLSHTLFANMGGFVIRTYASERLKKPTESGPGTTTIKSRYATHSTSAPSIFCVFDKKSSLNNCLISQLTNYLTKARATILFVSLPFSRFFGWSFKSSPVVSGI